MGGRTTGSLGKKTLEYVQAYDRLSAQYGDPLVVLFKLTKSRKQAIRFQAAKELISYRYPKQIAAKMELEAAGQIIMQWEDTIETPPASLPDARSAIDARHTVIEDKELAP